LSGWTTSWKAIREQQIGASSRRALVVEGADDRKFFEAALDKLRPQTWQTNWCLGVAGGKPSLLKILEKEPTWIGVVDRDEWTAAQIAERTGNLSNLKVLPRFCVESYFVEAAALWAAMPQAQKDKVPGGEITLRTAIEQTLDPWVRHGALWHAVNPLWEGLRSRGFQSDLLRFEVAQNDSDIQTKLDEWHSYLDPAKVFEEFQNELATANGMPVSDRLRLVVHGQKFFAQHVNQVLASHLGQMEAGSRLNQLITTNPPPTDLQPIWQAMGL
jgi:hypothetical protein